MTVPNKKDLRKLIRIYDRRRKSRNLCEALYVLCTLEITAACRLGRDSSEPRRANARAELNLFVYLVVKKSKTT